MGEKDLTENYLEAYNDVFADIINVLLCDGKRVILQEHLEADGNKTIYKADKKVHEQERDIAKFWKDGHIKIALLGLENQTDAHPYMPLRMIGYDGATYRSQILKEHEGEEKYPVISLVLYFGMNHWDKPRSLRECFKNIPKELSRYVNDYKIHVFEIAYLLPEQVAMFQSDFRIVADYFVQMRTNKEYNPSQEVMKHVDAVLKLMSVLTQDDRFEEMQNGAKGEVKTMCEVLDNAISKGRAEGKAEGRIEGRAEGKAEGRIEGRAEGKAEGRIEGRAEGRAEGIQAMVESCQELGVSAEAVKMQLVKKFSMTEQEAQQKLELYWK